MTKHHHLPAACRRLLFSAALFARPAAVRALYHVRFDPKPFWREGKAPEELLVELFEHWLEAA